MTDPRITKLAENLINNALALKAGENILIETTDTPDEVSTELIKAVEKVGGIPRAACVARCSFPQAKPR